MTWFKQAGVPKEDQVTFSVSVTKQFADSFEELLHDLKATAGMGHTFSIVVDPDEKGGRKYSMDGDGSEHIVEFKRVNEKEANMFSQGSIKEADDKDAIIQELLERLKAEHENYRDQEDIRSHVYCPTCMLIEKLEGQGKEANILDFPEYNREDQMKGDSGMFDEKAPVDRKTKTAPDPGPASLNPGMADIAPQIFE